MINTDFHRVFIAAPSNFMMLLPDDQFTIVEVTDYHLELLGRERIELIGRGLFDVYPSDDSADKLKESILKAIETKVPQSVILRYDTKKNGEVVKPRYWTVTNIPVIAKGVVKYILNTSVDVTLLQKNGFEIH